MSWTRPGPRASILPPYIPARCSTNGRWRKTRWCSMTWPLWRSSRFKGRRVAVELTDFSVFDSQDHCRGLGRLKRRGQQDRGGKGQIVKVSKDKDGIIHREVLTRHWTDWVDYWAVDFDFENKREIIRVQSPDSGEWEEVWTGDYIFENEWQSFRTKKDRSLELMSIFHECQPGRRKWRSRWWISSATTP